MIKNERQFGVTQNQARNFEAAIAEAKGKKVPQDTDPLLWKAYIEGMESQLTTMQREIAEYKQLKSGTVNQIEVGSLEEFPLGIIKARIVRGFTHKELADRIGVKPQQVQRWEDSDYETIGFNKLIKIGNALGISVHESISFRHEAKNTADKLNELGIDLKFLRKRLAPGAGKDLHDVLKAASGYLKRIWNLTVLGDGTIDTRTFDCTAANIARYKLPKDANPVRIRAYTQYAYYVAERVASSMSSDSQPIPRDWKEAREALSEDGRLSLQSALHTVWAMGIPVVPLSDTIRFHGCCWRFNGRNVIILKQSVRAESRWLFDLLHELYHAGENESHGFDPTAIDGTASERRDSEDERAANEFAGNILLCGSADDLYKEALSKAKGQLPQLKKAVRQVAKSHQVDVGVLANYVAYALKSEQDADWWGAAVNLQPESADAYSTTLSAFNAHFDGSSLPEEDLKLVMLATTEPSGLC
ncbi:XRE family transcriptional regulator [uncultured Roseibium sp.]|uniref:helix-turn-helix domain-containing protein n=1 Tax=uncultured Roseibium sp. TaxID=1936171 RepID=UPI002633AD2E|nr:XRE family transcriptional regulator [uncultured Roseibium sp.]